jgi:hypothetical protein
LKPKAGNNTARRDPLTDLNERALRREVEGLKRAIDDAGAYVVQVYKHRMTNLLLASDPMRGSDYSGAGTRSSAIPDPTAAGWEYAKNARLAEEIFATVVEARAALVRAARLLDSAPSGIDTAKIASQHQCRIGPSASREEFPWLTDDEQQCDRLDVNRNGICDKHRQRDDHDRRSVTRSQQDVA